MWGRRMSAPKIDDATLQIRLNMLREASGNKSEAARRLGITHSSMKRSVDEAAVRGILPDGEKPRARVPLYSLPLEKPFGLAEELPSEDIPLDELINFRIAEFNRKASARQARKLINIDIRIDGPIAISHFGDPHVDDPGSNLGLLEQHVNIINKTEGMFGANVGDLQNLWIGRLARLYANQSTTARDSWRLTEWFVRSVHWLYLLKGNHDCLDMETEALTRRGWVRYADIETTDQVLSLDSQTGAVHWHPILDRIHRANADHMVSIDIQGLSMCVTPKHRVLCQKRNWAKKWGALELKTADALPSRMRIPAAGNAIGRNGTDLSLAQISLAGWLLTDGGISWTGKCPSVSFYQSKDTQEIVYLLAYLNLEHRVDVRQRDTKEICGRALLSPPRSSFEFHLTAEASRKVLAWVPEKGRLPDWCHDLNDGQFQVLLEALMSGDGSWNSNGSRTSGVLHGTKEFLGSVQSVAVQHGWRAHLTTAREKDWRLNLCHNSWIELERKPNVKQSVSDEVWCLTVPLGNFMVRRKGTAYFTGNCWAGDGDPLDHMVRSLDGVVEPHGARLNLRFPNGRQVRINARHDFRGHSMWNTAHGPAKAAQMGWRDHILTCGHKHTAGYHPVMDPASGLISHAIRVGAYKRIDDYADANGMIDQNFSENITTVINPAAKDEKDLVTVIFDVETAADFLTFLRRKGV